MNSFNHYAYGSVCESIYSRIAGLRNMAPGWKKVMIKPQINYRMKKMKFSYDSISGRYKIYWKWLDNKFIMNISIPFGTEAEIILPDGQNFNVTGGNYTYECDINKNIYAPFSIDTPIIDILNNDNCVKIIKDLLPDIYNEAIKTNNYIKINNIRNVNRLYNFNYPINIIEKCDEELLKIRP